MTRLVVSAEAEADTGRILAYLHREAGAQIATAYGLRFQRRIEALLEAPETGAPRPTLGPNTRIALVFPYLSIYDYVSSGDTITLLRILHGRRNITRDMLDR